jgi:hypothetical protein
VRRDKVLVLVVGTIMIVVASVLGGLATAGRLSGGDSGEPAEALQVQLTTTGEGGVASWVACPGVPARSCAVPF